MKFLSVIALGLLSSSAMAASFDCNTTGLNSIEKAICKVPELSMMDQQLADAYKVVRHIPEVKADQKTFIKDRNSAPSLGDLKDLMRDRIIELEIIAELEGVEAKPYSERQVKPPKPIGSSSVGQLITQFKNGNTAVYNGQYLDATYRRSDAPSWALGCSAKIVDNDVLPKWAAEASKNKLSSEFADVRWKFDVAMFNATLTNLLKNTDQSKTMCDIINVGM
ncbi:hypothetical protein [Aeromonas phage L9-6]|nr:hypothetical protein [Aeromonas phage L9-6]